MMKENYRRRNNGLGIGAKGVDEHRSYTWGWELAE
jgi:hypothetical protein